MGRTSGKQTIKTETFRKKRDADNRAAKIHTMKDEGVLVTPSKETLAGYLARWLTEVKEGVVRARTLDDYRSIIRRYIEAPPKGTPAIGKVRLNRLTPAAFRSLYDHLRREMHLAPRTIEYVHTVLRQALKQAVLDGNLARNPTDGVKVKTQQLEDGEENGQESRTVNAMTELEAGQFLEQAKADRYYALWCVLLTGGLRPGEAFGLQWEDVDLETGKLHVRRSLTRRGIKASWRLTEPKTKRARRVVPLPAMAIQALRAWRAEQGKERLLLGAEYEQNDFVFATEFGKPLHGENISQRNFRRIMAAAELGTWEGKRFRPGIPHVRLAAYVRHVVIVERGERQGSERASRARQHHFDVGHVLARSTRHARGGGGEDGGHVRSGRMRGQKMLPKCSLTLQNRAKQGKTRPGGGWF